MHALEQLPTCTTPSAPVAHRTCRTIEPLFYAYIYDARTGRDWGDDVDKQAGNGVAADVVLMLLQSAELGADVRAVQKSDQLVCAAVEVSEKVGHAWLTPSAREESVAI